MKMDGETDAEVQKRNEDIESVLPNKEVWEIDRGTVVGTFLVLADNAGDALYQAERLLEKRHDTETEIQGIRRIGFVFAGRM